MIVCIPCKNVRTSRLSSNWSRATKRGNRKLASWIPMCSATASGSYSYGGVCALGAQMRDCWDMKQPPVGAERTINSFFQFPTGGRFWRTQRLFSLFLRRSSSVPSSSFKIRGVSCILSTLSHARLERDKRPLSQYKLKKAFLHKIVRILVLPLFDTVPRTEIT